MRRFRASIPAPTQQALRTLEWVHRRENLVVCGPSGTGKTFLLEALGQQAVEAGLKRNDDFNGARQDGFGWYQLTTRDGRRHVAADFVFAAGPWLPQLFPRVLGDVIRVTKQDVVFVGPPPGDGRFAAESLPCWLDSQGAVYGLPAVDGRGMKVGPDRYGPLFDPTDGERLVDPESVRLVRSYLAWRFPDLAGAPVVETRVCQYETTPDTHFIIDRHPGWENAWVVGDHERRWRNEWTATTVPE